MKNIQLRGMSYTPNAFDSLVRETIVATIQLGHSVNAFVVASELNATRSRATRENIAASLERLTAAGWLVREDFAITGAAPAYRRVR